jgi:hypothetical protein
MFVSNRFYFKKSKNMYKKSLTHPIVQNNKMSKFQKFRSLSLLVYIPIGHYLWKHSVVFLLGIQVEYQPLFCETLIRKKEILMKKGYRGQVEIWMSEKVFSKYSIKNQIELRLLGVRVA